MFANLVIRQANAAKSFLECVTEAGLSAADAERVLAYYLKHKLVKLGANDGQFHVKHGSLMDAECFRKAADLPR